MIKRILQDICFPEDSSRQMRFVAGPRQTGKTTLVKHFLKNKKLSSLYYNWDIKETRTRFYKDFYFFEEDIYDFLRLRKRRLWICFDEIHKMPKWKNVLKDYFDKHEEKINFIITGSARLEYLRRGGDSLAGRYFLFKLYPLILREITSLNREEDKISGSALEFIEKRLSYMNYPQEKMETLLKLSGFPEPFLSGKEAFYNRWEHNYVDAIVREDLRDLTKIMFLDKLVHTAALLPEKVGSPLSINSLKEDLETNYNTVKNYVRALEMGYIIFLVQPYHKRINRAVKKEKKCYFFDWAKVKNIAARFENYVAVELLCMIELWNARGEGDFELSYIRTKDGKETDFLVTKESVPWCLFEVKLSAADIASHHFKHSNLLENIPFVQLVYENRRVRKTADRFYSVSACRFFGG